MHTRAMTEADLPRAAALSAAAGWNQTEADWRLFLDGGTVRVVDDGDPACLAASAGVLRHGPDAAWISMVLVRPDRRRAGLATALMGWAVAAASGIGCVALDATPAGRPVYARLGFGDAFGFARWRVAAPLRAPAIGVRPMTEADWPAVAALDAAAFGAPRAAMLRSFAARLPGAAWMASDGSGYALGRDGRLAPQIGPVVAGNAATGLALLAAAQRGIGGPFVADIADKAGEVAAALTRAGAEQLRPFTRMTLGAPPPGDAARLIAMGGPEVG